MQGILDKNTYIWDNCVIEYNQVMIMFKKGEYVAHYKQGVCEVLDIGKLDMSCSDRRKEYYTLKPVYDEDGVVYTPVSNERGQIRSILTEEEARFIIEDIPNVEELQVSDEKKREEFYRKMMFKNECRAWISVMKTSYLRKMKRLACGKRVINVDDRYLSIAEGFLCGELAAALAMTKEEVKACIISKMKE